MAKLVRAGHEKQMNKINKKESSDDSGLPGDSDSAGMATEPFTWDVSLICK